jgi:hypothetical protein
MTDGMEHVESQGSNSQSLQGEASTFSMHSGNTTQPGVTQENTIPPWPAVVPGSIPPPPPPPEDVIPTQPVFTQSNYSMPEISSPLSSTTGIGSQRRPLAAWKIAVFGGLALLVIVGTALIAGNYVLSRSSNNGTRANTGATPLTSTDTSAPGDAGTPESGVRSGDVKNQSGASASTITATPAADVTITATPTPTGHVVITATSAPTVKATATPTAAAKSTPTPTPVISLPAASCSSLGSKIEADGVYASGSKVGELQIYYNSSTGDNCAYFQSLGAARGVAKKMYVSIQVCQETKSGGTCTSIKTSHGSSSDSGTYSYYAGPVGVYGKGRCISSYGGMVWNGVTYQFKTSPAASHCL